MRWAIVDNDEMTAGGSYVEGEEISILVGRCDVGGSKDENLIPTYFNSIPV